VVAGIAASRTANMAEMKVWKKKCDSLQLITLYMSSLEIWDNLDMHYKDR
jgi:hypothetical protein